MKNAENPVLRAMVAIGNRCSQHTRERLFAALDELSTLALVTARDTSNLGERDALHRLHVRFQDQSHALVTLQAVKKGT